MSTENQRVAEWLRLLGCPVELSEGSLRSLNAPRMRSIWRHLQKHVMSRQNVHLIRTNLLLAKLKEINALPSKFGYIIESVKDLSEVQNLESLQAQINSVETEIKKLDEKLEQTSIMLFTRMAQLESIKSETEEYKTKTILLNLKLTQMHKDTDYISKETKKIKHMAFFQKPVPRDDQRLVIQAMFPKYMSVHSKSLLLGNNGDDAARVIAKGCLLPPSVIYDAICYTSQKALRSLNQLQMRLNRPAIIDSLRKKQQVRDVLSFSKQLDELHSKIVENEFSLQRYDKNIKTETNELQKIKTLVVNLLNEIFAGTNEDENCHKEVVDLLEKNAMLIKKEEIIQTYINQFNTDCSNFESLQFEVDKIDEQVNDSNLKVEKCVNEINELVSAIFNNNFNTVKAESLKKCTDNAGNLLTRLKQEDYSELFVMAERKIVEEVEMFEKAPMAAIRREWNNGANDVIKDPQLILLLSHSEPKNIIQTMLEKVLMYK